MRADAVPEDLLRLLKSETAAHHEAVEAQVTFFDQADPGAAYAAYLEKLYGFHAPLEARLGALPLPAALRGREKAPLLAQDLTALGRDPARLPLCPALPDVSTEARALGCAYVLEGATLGGKFVRRRLAGRVPPEATAYLGCYGDEVGARWTAFREVVRAQVPPAEFAVCVRAAQQTFEALFDWLRR